MNSSGDIHIECKESKIFEEVFDHPHPIIENDVKANKVLTKDMLRYFNLKVHNLLLLPITIKRGNQIQGVMCLLNKTIQTIKTDEIGVKTVIVEPKNFTL